MEKYGAVSHAIFILATFVYDFRYTVVAFLVGFYNFPWMGQLMPKSHDTSLTKIVANCAVILLLSSALPLFVRVIGMQHPHTVLYWASINAHIHHHAPPCTTRAFVTATVLFFFSHESPAHFTHTGITNFDLLGNFVHISWLRNLKVIVGWEAWLRFTLFWPGAERPQRQSPHPVAGNMLVSFFSLIFSLIPQVQYGLPHLLRAGVDRPCVQVGVARHLSALEDRHQRHQKSGPTLRPLGAAGTPDRPGRLQIAPLIHGKKWLFEEAGLSQGPILTHKWTLPRNFFHFAGGGEGGCKIFLFFSFFFFFFLTTFQRLDSFFHRFSSFFFSWRPAPHAAVVPWRFPSCIYL